MVNRMGIWLDGRSAVLVRLVYGQSDFRHFQGEPIPDEAPVSAAGGEAAEARNTLADERRQRTESRRLSSMFDDITPYFRDADEALVLGPNEAKGLFVTRLESRNRRVRVLHVGTVARMSDVDFGAYVWSHKAAPAQTPR